MTLLDNTNDQFTSGKKEETKSESGLFNVDFKLIYMHVSYAMLCYVMLCSTYIILYYIILYYIILYHIILYHIISYYINYINYIISY